MTMPEGNFAATNHAHNLVDFEHIKVIDRRKIIETPNMKDYHIADRILADTECTDCRY